MARPLMGGAQVQALIGAWQQIVGAEVQQLTPDRPVNYDPPRRYWGGNPPRRHGWGDRGYDGPEVVEVIEEPVYYEDGDDYYDGDADAEVFVETEPRYYGRGRYWGDGEPRRYWGDGEPRGRYWGDGEPRRDYGRRPVNVQVGPGGRPMPGGRPVNVQVNPRGPARAVGNPSAQLPGGLPGMGVLKGPKVMGWYDIVDSAEDPRNWLIEEPGADRAGREILPMSSGTQVILPNHSASITARPQRVAFRPERVFISENGDGAANWLVNDILIGNRSQFSQAGQIPGDIFATTAIDSFVSFETAQTAMDVVMVITYVGPTSDGQPFYGAMIGTAAV